MTNVQGARSDNDGETHVDMTSRLDITDETARDMLQEKSMVDT